MSVSCILFFKDSTGYGWSERFWYAGTTSDPTFTNNINALINARCLILTSTCFVTHVRVASSISRAPYIFAQPAGGVPGGETPPTAPSEVALLARLIAGGTSPYFNRPFLRGIPERVVASDNFVTDNTFDTNLIGFFNVLKNGNWNVQGRLTNAPNPLQPISTLTPLPPRGFNFSAAANIFAVGDIVRIRGARVPGYNGLKSITARNPAGTLYEAGGAAAPVVDTGLSPTAQLQKSFDLTIAITNIEGLTRRGAGRPFGLTRGRKQTLYSLCQ